MPKGTPHVLVRALSAALLAATPVAMAAQSPSLAPPPGASVIVIVPDSLANPPRTVSELLRAYAPAAAVQRSTGAAGASAWVSLRDASAILGGDPLVVVDGIRQVSHRVNLDTLDRRAPSILDDVMVEDIERVEILPGPAAAASYGYDGGRGAIVITTRAPGHGHPRFNASVTTSSGDANAPYARNLSRTSAGGYPCPYYLEQAAGCTPNVTTRYTPLLDRSPFRSAQQLRAHLGAVGGLGPLGYAATLGAERGSGTMASDAVDRTVASLRLQLPVSSLVRIGLSSFATGRGITYPSGGNHSVLEWGVGGGPLDCSPATPCGTDSSSGGYRYPLSWLEGGQPHRRIGHLGSALTVDLDPLPALALRTSVTADMFRDEESLRDSSPPGYMATLTEATAEERSWRIDAAQEARYTASVAGAVATTTLALRFGADRGRSASRTSIVALPAGYPGGAYSLATTDAWLFADHFSQALEQRLAWGERVALGAGLLRSTTRFDHGAHAPALFDPRADAMFDAVPPSSPLGILRSLRLRSAWGRTSSQSLWALSTTGIPAGGSPFGGYGGPGAVMPRRPAERSTELEGGVDAAFAPSASRLSITAFRREERLDYIAPVGLGLPAGRKVTGVELLADATPIDLAAARLHLRGQLAVSHDRLHGAPFTPLILSSGPGVELVVANGQSWGAWLTQPARWSDANGNGRIERSEVSFFAVTTGGRSRPSSIASLAGDLEIARSITLTAVLDHVGGFDVYDAASAQQCWRQVCPALNDPSAAIDEQGRAVAVASMQRGAGFVVPGDATRLRQLTVSWRSPRAASLLHATNLQVALSGYDLARWSRSRGPHPETDMPAPGLNPDLWSIVQPIPRTFALRVALGY